MSGYANDLPAWSRLAELAQSVPTVAECCGSAERDEMLRLSAAGLDVDFSKQRISTAVLAELLELATEADLPGRRKALLEGEHVNTSEDRPALHTALRAEPGRYPQALDGPVQNTLDAMRALVDGLSDGSRRGHTGRAITDIVHIGIGGSHLGPELAVQALQPTGRFRVHFVANIDGHAMATALAACHPETTLFVVVSKSFGTLETLTNAETARAWFLERGGAPEAISNHFYAISANTERAAEFGIPAQNVMPMWDWVGGRYSLWSAVGLPIALACGFDAFEGLLAGARAMDEHFASAPLAQNVPVIAALVGIWNTNFLGASNHAVLAYDERLTLLPLYLQQLETESNGKRVRLDGQLVQTHTMPILWGGVGSSGQHAYHQLLHQGTRAFSADFIFARNADHDLTTHHRWLQANALAQSQAMMVGDPDQPLDRQVPGNHPTTTILLPQLSPRALGALLALYEHKVFCQGTLWGINPFDQWGVELGKRLANPIFDALEGQPSTGQDSSTAQLIERLKR